MLVLWFSAGYRGIYKKRADPLVDGCAIFYRADFELVYHKDIEFVFGSEKSFNHGNVGKYQFFA